MAFNQNQTQSITFLHNPPHQNSHRYPFPTFLLVLLLIILATVSLLITYFTFLTKCCTNWNQFNPLRSWISILMRSTQHNNDEEPFIALSPTTWNRGGVDESVIREIPAFQFTTTEGETTTIVDQSVYCCMVCLTEFRDHDMLKILPNCSHVFHLDCIDIWLQSNSNCPLCRSSISGNTNFPFDHIIAPSSSPQDSQVLSNMGSDEDFVVIELGGDHERVIQQEKIDSREKRIISQIGNLKPKRKFFHHVSIMGDECIDVREKDEEFCVQPMIRRSFSMDSANDRQVYLDVQAIIQQKRLVQNEASGSEGCSSRGRRSFFPFCYGKGSKNSVLPLESFV